MATTQSRRSLIIDPRNGYCADTKTFHSLRPSPPLPPESQPLSAAAYALSLLPSPLPLNPALIDAATAMSVSYSTFISRVKNLATSLGPQLHLAAGDIAFVLSPARLDVPILYFSLLSSGVVVSPANPLSSPSELAFQTKLTSPKIAFTTSAFAAKLPKWLPKILLDGPDFQNLLHNHSDEGNISGEVGVKQSDTAAILYSSGTTGRVKGVKLSHRNFIALISGYKATREEALAAAAAAGETEGPSVGLFTLPLFHIFGFFMAMRAVALGETLVLMGSGKFDLETMLKAVEEHKVTYAPVAPPLVVAMVKSEEAKRRDLSSLKLLGSGGAPLGRDVAERFTARFPNVEISQGYGLTESAGGATATMGPEENKVYGSVGRLSPYLEAKIVDPATGETLSPGKQGELWLRGPTIMQGYVGDDEATAAALDSSGWLKTGDLCYFDDDGFLFIVDRLKELIKYKAYQVPPAELEHILHSHPGIADVAVIPYPDEEAGQIPMAYVVRQPGSTLNEEDVKDFVAKQVAPYKKVRRVAFVTSIPKSPAGKILRRELIKHALSNSKL